MISSVSHLHHVVRLPICDCSFCLLQNVTEQVSLWEAESDRVQHQRAYLYGNFASPEMFALTLKFATDSRYMLWSNPEKQMVACKLEAHPSMREYIKSIK